MYFEGMPGRTNFTETAPPVDALAEFKLQANQISAEYGNTGSAVVTFTAKSGTNEFHGQAFNILRNEKLDARSFFAPTRPALRQNEFGATLGGPVWIPKLYRGRDRTFFFFGYSGSRKRGADQIVLQRVATPAERAGDFRALNRLVYDPATTRNTPAGFVRDPFPGNQIPAARFDRVAAGIAARLPEPNFSGGDAFNRIGFTGERLLDPNLYVVKIDHQFTPLQKITGSYVFTSLPRETLGAGQLIADPFSGLSFQFIQSHMLRGTYDWTLRPNLLNTLTLGFNRFREPNRGLFANQGWAERLGLRGTVGDAFPAFSFADGYSPLGTNSNFLSFEQAALVRNTTSYSRGRQLMKFGVEYRLNLRSRLELGNTGGSYAFSNLPTALPAAPSTSGNGWATFLLGQTTSGSVALPFQNKSRRPYWGMFFQDDIRVTPRLTLNLGLRYEMNLAPYDLENAWSFVDLSLPNPAAGNRPGAAVFAGPDNRKLLPGDFGGIGPRVGFAWRADSRTAVRGGYGVYYADNGFFPLSSNLGLRISQSFATLDQGITPAFVLSDGLPTNYSRTPVLRPDALNNNNVNSRSGSISSPSRTQNWSLSIQRELSTNWVMELSYVGNHNTRQIAPTMINENQLHPRFLALGSLLTQQVTSPAAIAAGIELPYPGFRGSVAQALRAYPQYLVISEPVAKAGRSIYHGFTARARKRYSSGFTLDAHYTFSKNMGYSEFGSFLPGNVGFGTTNNILQDNFNRQLEWSRLPSDMPHALVLNYSYELPLGKKSRLTSGWLVAGIHRYVSGQPLSVLMNNTLPIFSRVLRPDVAPGVSRSTGISGGDFEPATDLRLNRAAFAFPAPFSIGTAAPTYSDARNFPVLQEDFSLIKNTKINERFSVEVIGQFINAFNRHRFTDIQTNLSAAQFGRVAGSNNGRIITAGLRFRY
jgi:hypothetical protein